MDFADNIFQLRYAWDTARGKETWEDAVDRVLHNVLKAVPVSNGDFRELQNLMYQRKFIPGGRFLAQAGRPYHQTNNCFLVRAEDTREGWGEVTQKATTMLMSGGGIGIDYSDLRASGTPLKRTGGHSSGPLPLMRVVNEVGRGVMSGGKRRSAIWAGLRWSHPDIFDFILAKNWIPEVRALKEKDYDFPATLDMTNISVILDRDFFEAFDHPDNSMHEHAQRVYWETVKRMVKTGEPGFSVDYNNKNESLRNACTEIVSEDDCDVCCLGSINLGAIDSLDELNTVTELGQMFLLAGTEYSDVPYPKVQQVRDKNRRTGLGLMGIHEWLIKRNYKYEPNNELATWLGIWKATSDYSASVWAGHFGFRTPVAKRAIAPNGTTAIAGGKTTGGIEPIFAVAYKRRYLTPEGWRHQYVVDSVAERLVNEGVNPDTIEDAYTLSGTVEKRIAFQAFVQGYVDNSISSTVNIPSTAVMGEDFYKDFGTDLLKYLPQLRGITVYPDGARGGQPLTVSDYRHAVKNKGVVFESREDCAEGVCGL